MGSPGVKPGMKRSGTLPVFPAVPETEEKELGVPVRFAPIFAS